MLKLRRNVEVIPDRALESVKARLPETMDSGLAGCRGGKGHQVLAMIIGPPAKIGTFRILGLPPSYDGF
jgi:hypothetical protein